MLRRKENCRNEIILNMKGGSGEFHLLHMAEAKEMADRATLFARGLLPPGSTVGIHRHQGTMEICCFLSGSGLVREEDGEYLVSSGDVSICYDGECHEIINTGVSALAYLVLVIKTA